MRTFINSSSLFRVLFLFDIYFSGLSYAPLIMFLYLSFGLFVMVLIIFSFNSACVNATNQIINNNDPKRVNHYSTNNSKKPPDFIQYYQGLF